MLSINSLKITWYQKDLGVQLSCVDESTCSTDSVTSEIHNTQHASAHLSSSANLQTSPTYRHQRRRHRFKVARRAAAIRHPSSFRTDTAEAGEWGELGGILGSGATHDAFTCNALQHQRFLYARNGTFRYLALKSMATRCVSNRHQLYFIRQIWNSTGPSRAQATSWTSGTGTGWWRERMS